MYLVLNLEQEFNNSHSSNSMYFLPFYHSLCHTFVFSSRGLVTSPPDICLPRRVASLFMLSRLDTIDVRFSSLNIRGEYKPSTSRKGQNGWSQAWPGLPDTRLWYIACWDRGGASHLSLWLLQGVNIFYSSIFLIHFVSTGLREAPRGKTVWLCLPM